MSTIQHVVFRRAAEATGGPEQLSAALGVELESLGRWMRGIELAPTHVFNRAAEIASSKPARPDSEGRLS
jgi:hypothetical protein